MATGYKVEVNTKNLENYISKLDALYEDCTSYNNTSLLNDVGKTADAMEVVENKYNSIVEKLAGLVLATKNLMVNAKDGLIETDEKNAEGIDTL